MHSRTAFRLLALLATLAGPVAHGEPHGEPRLEAHVTLTQTVAGLGAAQGVTVLDGKVYLYGDANPGVIREYTADAHGRLTPTGRRVSLTVGGKNVINHPTGLAVHPKFGVFLGNTRILAGSIYHLDWDRMWERGTLDGAILNVTQDDLGVQGARPEFVRVNGRWLLATADYGDHTREPKPNAVRLYDPAKLAKAKSASEPGVLVASFPSGPWVQNLHWLDGRGVLILVQNITEGLGWRLTETDLGASLRAGAEVQAQVLDLPPKDEMEGFAMLDASRGLGISSSEHDNLKVIELTPRPVRAAP